MTAGSSGDVDALAERVHRSLLAESLSRPSADDVAAATRRAAPLLGRDEVDQVCRRVLDRFDLLGPLTGVVDDDVSEVIVDGPGHVRIERHGRLVATDVRMSAAELDVLIERLVGPTGRRVDQRSPIVDARLPDGSRLNVVVPPVAVDGPYLTIRRFPARWPSLEDFGGPAVVGAVDDLVARRRNIVVSGGTGAGKTSLLRALIDRVDPGERVVTIEDAVELEHPCLVRLEARPASVEGVAEVGVRDLVRTALRMRPDRLVVGEVRGGEAFDLVQALNTGHAGSLSTVHANGPADALARMAVLCLMTDAELPVGVAEREVARAVDAVVHVERSDSGHRRIDSVLTLDGDDRRPTVLVHETVDGDR